ncbi:hypothetical protein OJE16_11320 [Pantoea tagorei]
MQRGQCFWQIGRRALFQHDTFDIEIQHGAQDCRVVVHGENNNRQVRIVTFDIFDQRDAVAIFLAGHGEIGDQDVGVKL